MDDAAPADWPIEDVARLAGTTSRTLRHYDDIGLLEPTRIGPGGHRYYDQDRLVRLQRILLLRELGLGLPAIAEMLDGQRDPVAALRAHLHALEEEKDRVVRRIEAVRTTIRKTEAGEALMAEEMFDGFDPTGYEQEVSDRWGRDAYEKGDRWWRSLTASEQRAFRQSMTDISADYGRAKQAGEAVEGDRVQQIARRHVEWLAITTRPSYDYVTGLGEMYVADPRFTGIYDQHGEGTAAYVRDALTVYAQCNLAVS